MPRKWPSLLLVPDEWVNGGRICEDWDPGTWVRGENVRYDLGLIESWGFGGTGKATASGRLARSALLGIFCCNLTFVALISRRFDLV